MTELEKAKVYQEVTDWIYSDKHLSMDIFNRDLSYEYQSQIFNIALESVKGTDRFSVWSLALLDYDKLDPRIQKRFLDLKNVNSYVYLRLYQRANIEPKLKEYIFTKSIAVRKRCAEISRDFNLIFPLIHDKSIKVRYALLHNPLFVEYPYFFQIMSQDPNSKVRELAIELLEYEPEIRNFYLNMRT